MQDECGLTIRFSQFSPLVCLIHLRAYLRTFLPTKGFPPFFSSSLHPGQPCRTAMALLRICGHRLIKKIARPLLKMFFIKIVKKIVFQTLPYSANPLAYYFIFHNLELKLQQCSKNAFSMRFQLAKLFHSFSLKEYPHTAPIVKHGFFNSSLEAPHNEIIEKEKGGYPTQNP